MKKIQILGTALFATFALSAAFAATYASAAPEWLFNGGVATEAKNDTDQTKAENLTLEYLPLLGLKIVVGCEASMPGTAGPGAAGSITEVKFTECLILEGSEGTGLEETAPLIGPFSTELILVEPGGVNLYRDLILTTGGKNFGWLIKVNLVDITCEWKNPNEAFAEAIDEVLGFVDWTFHGSEGITTVCSPEGEGKLNGLLDYEVAGFSLAVSG